MSSRFLIERFINIFAKQSSSISINRFLNLNDDNDDDDSGGGT